MEINLTKERKDLHTENYKTFVNEIKDVHFNDQRGQELNK